MVPTTPNRLVLADDPWHAPPVAGRDSLSRLRGDRRVAFEESPGIERASADHEAGSVAVAGNADEAAVVEAIRAAGYEPA